MNSKLILVIALAAAVVGKPSPKNPKNYIHRTINVSPNLKSVSFERIAKSAVAKPAQKPIPGPKVKVEGCGQAPLAGSKNTKIVGGEEATPHAYPWQVALYIDGTYFCGGSIISADWILTAAHCMLDARKVEVVAGAHNLKNLSEASQVRLTSTTFTVYEGFALSDLHNDISVIQLPQSLTFTDEIQPICLPVGDDIGAGVPVVATGWGKTSDSVFQFTSDTLNEVDITTTAQTDCSDYYSAEYFTDDMVCVDTTGGHGICHGDSGGPLNYYGGSAEGVETRGIASYISSSGCLSGAPSSFTRVNHFLDWIEQNTGVTV